MGNSQPQFVTPQSTFDLTTDITWPIPMVGTDVDGITTPRIVARASSIDNVRAVPRLRISFFAEEMGALLMPRILGYDIDLFNGCREHLPVRVLASGELFDVHRVLTPAHRKRVDSTYTVTQFNRRPVCHRCPRMADLVRSCVRPTYRQGGVVLALRRALGTPMAGNGPGMLACASIPMHHQVPGSSVASHQAASIWHQFGAQLMASYLPLPVDELQGDLPVQPPALIQAYLRMGAKVLGAPAWDPDFNTADLPMLICLQDLPARYRKHFLQEA